MAKYKVKPHYVLSDKIRSCKDISMLPATSSTDTIEAIQLAKAGEEVSDEIHAWLDARSDKWESDRDEGILVKSVIGVERADPGDWVVERADGQLYTCNPDLFAELYEEVVESEPAPKSSPKPVMKPCPFCGSAGQVVKNSFPPRNRFRHPSCTNYDCIAYVEEQDEQGGTNCDYTTDEECIEYWNTRADGELISLKFIEMERRQHFRTLALRFLDGFVPQPTDAVVLADAICSYDGPIDMSTPVRWQAHAFVHEAYRVIHVGQNEPKDQEFNSWLLEWHKKFG